MLKDQWVISYERLRDILYRAGVSMDLSVKQRRKMLLNHRESITTDEFQEALKLFEYLYVKDEL